MPVKADPPGQDLTEETAPRPRRGKLPIAVGVLAAALAAVTVWTVPRPTGDLYVALAAGRDFFDGKLGALDDWAFTTEGRVWVNQNWGTHLTYYLFYKAFGGVDGDKYQTEGADGYLGAQDGETGLLLLKLLLIGMGTTFLVLACRRRGARWPVALIVAALVIAAGRSFIDLRPNLTTLMLAPVMLFLLYRTIDKPSRIWTVMIVFGLIWANVHGGFFLGLITMGIWVFYHLLARMLEHPLLRRILFRMIYVVMVAALVWLFCGAGEVAEGTRRLATLLTLVIGTGVNVGWSVFGRRKERPGGSRGKADVPDLPGQFRSELSASIKPRWQFIVALLGAFVLAGVATPFGVHQLFRDYSKLNMEFWEIWNLTHPFVVMAGEDSELWRSVIEWHSPFTASYRTFGTTWEFFGLLGLFGLLVPLHVLIKRARKRGVDLEDVLLLVLIVVVAAVAMVRAFETYEEFDTFVRAYREKPQQRAALHETPTQQAGWLACGLVSPGIGLFAVVTLLLVGMDRLAGKRVEIFRGRRLGTALFDITMAGLAIFYFGFRARRFMPLALILIAPLLARRLQWFLAWGGRLLAADGSEAGAPEAGDAEGVAGGEPEDLSGRVIRSLPVLAAGVGAVVLIGMQTWDNALRYLPYSPRVRHRSMLKNMIVYNMFPPNARDFIQDNQLSGKAFNEWRWEGYLHWYAPAIKSFIGGRAQQVYDIETYKQQRRLLSGRESPAWLQRRDVRWLIVPLNTGGYETMLRQAAFSSGAAWVPVFCDGENIILVNTRLPGGREAVAKCLENRYIYRSRAHRALSQAFCLRSTPVNKPTEAIAKVKESQQHEPLVLAYTSLRDLYQSTPIPLVKEVQYLRKEVDRLGEMDYRRLGGLKILQCRRIALSTLGGLYALGARQTKGAAKQKFIAAQRALQREIAEADAHLAEVIEKWR